MSWPENICRLCLQRRELQQSHIISELLYRHTYDEKHRNIYVETGDSTRGPRTLQKGIRERLLCRDCESRLNRWETPAADVIYNRERRPFVGPGSPLVQSVAINNVDYASFRLFQLSILWRATISKEPLFKRTRLHMSHTERLRTMLRRGEPGEPHVYGCLVVDPKHEALARTITVSRPFKYDSYDVHKFLMGGLEWWFFVSDDWDGYPLSGYFLSPSGVLPIVDGTPELSELAWRKMARDAATKKRSQSA